MSIPVNPTVNDLVLEGFKKALIPNPTTTQIARGTDIWMEEIKNDIMNAPGGRKLKSLTSKAIAIVDAGKAWFDRPSDFQADMRIELLDGNVTGIAQAGTFTSVTLSSTETILQGDILGKEILITSGSGKGSYSEVIAYDAVAKIASVSPDFTNTPANGDGYMIVESHWPLDPTPVWQAKKIHYPLMTIKPDKYFPVGDDDNGEFRLNSIPDKTYGLLLEYYTDLQKIDLTSARMTTIYRKWRNVFVYGIFARILQSINDDREETETQKYFQAIKMLLASEIDGYDLSNLRFQVSDY